MTTSKKFKVTKNDGAIFFKPFNQGSDMWVVNGGTIAGKYYPVTRFMSKIDAKVVCDARNRLVAKKAKLTHKIRAGGKK